MRTPKIERFTGVDGYWRVRLVGANGEKVLTSESYSRRGSATRAAKRLLRLIAGATITCLALMAGGCVTTTGNPAPGMVGSLGNGTLDLGVLGPLVPYLTAAADAKMPGAGSLIGGILGGQAENGVPAGYRIVWDVFDPAGNLVDLSTLTKSPRLERVTAPVVTPADVSGEPTAIPAAVPADVQAALDSLPK